MVLEGLPLEKVSLFRSGKPGKKPEISGCKERAAHQREPKDCGAGGGINVAWKLCNKRMTWTKQGLSSISVRTMKIEGMQDDDKPWYAGETLSIW